MALPTSDQFGRPIASPLHYPVVHMPQAPMPGGPPRPNLFTQSPDNAPQADQNAQYAQNDYWTYGDDWDWWNNWQTGYNRKYWKISRQNTEGPFKFDGELSQYKAWKKQGA